MKKPFLFFVMYFFVYLAFAFSKDEVVEITYESVELTQPIVLNISPNKQIRLVRKKEDMPKLKRTTSFFEWYLGAGACVTRGTNYAIAGVLGFNFNISDDFSTGIYTHAEYFNAPLGSTSGELAGMEMEMDVGLRIMFPMFYFKPFSIKIGAEVGYYAQILQFNSNISSKTHILYNGMVIRPVVMLEAFNFLKSPIGVCVFWTFTAIVPYSDYNNLGILFVI